MRPDAAQLVVVKVPHAMQMRSAGEREFMVARLKRHARAGLSWQGAWLQTFGWGKCRQMARPLTSGRSRERTGL